MTRRRRLQSGRFPWYGLCETIIHRNVIHSKNVTFDFFEIFCTSVRKVQGRAHASAVGGRRRRVQLDLDRPKKRSKIDLKFDQFSVSILDRFGVVLGSQLGVIFGQISSPNRLGTGFISKTSMSTKWYKNKWKTNKNAPRASPKTTQNRPKSVPRGDFFALKFRPRFGIDFGAILAPKMPPFGHPFGDQNPSKKRSKIGLLQVSL